MRYTSALSWECTNSFSRTIREVFCIFTRTRISALSRAMRKLVLVNHKDQPRGRQSTEDVLSIVDWKIFCIPSTRANTQMILSDWLVTRQSTVDNQVLFSHHKSIPNDVGNLKWERQV